jgi:hypothetical protein
MQYTHTVLTTASPEKVWDIWKDVKNWKNWEEVLVDSKITGDFETNAKGVLISEQGPKAKFKISACTPFFTYTVDTQLPFAHLYIRRLIGYHNKKTMITNEVWMEGPLSSFWWRFIGQKYLDKLPNIMARFKKLAEA